MKMEMLSISNYKVCWLVLLCLNNVYIETHAENKGEIKEALEENNEIEEIFGETYRQTYEDKHSVQKGNSPIKFGRRSTRQVPARVRREVRTLVDALKANAEKLENLTNGLGFLVNSAKDEQVGYSDIMHKLENVNQVLMQKLESMNPFFVSIFLMLADVTLSTSPRISKHPGDIFSMMKYFRENITTKADIDTFDSTMHALLEWYSKSQNLSFTSCKAIRDTGFQESGLYTITVPESGKLLRVWCDQDTDGGGWLVIQRRQDGSENFLRSWSDYHQGFGNVNSEFWLGNDNLHHLTKTRQELRVDIIDFDDNTAYAKYSSFIVGSSSEYYKMTVDGYSGNAGDSMRSDNGGRFYVVNQGNTCVNNHKGPWWRVSCLWSNLNGIYSKNGDSGSGGTHLSWYKWKSNFHLLKKSEMKIHAII